MADRHNRDIDRLPAPLPEPLTISCIDSHVHLEIIIDTSPDDPAIGEILRQAESVGIDRVVQVGYSVAQSQWSIACAEKFDTQVLAAVALHPNEAPIVDDLEKDLEKIAEMADHPRVCAIGETGLDFFRTPPELRDRQKYSFRRHIEIAKTYKKALVIHNRDSHRDVLDLLDEEGAPEKVIFHCFSGGVDMAEECIKKGYILSFAGTVTFKNAPELREAVRLVPLDQILVETDSPFLAPMPHRGSLNTPAQIPRILRAIAEERNEDLEVLINAINANALQAFGPFVL